MSMTAPVLATELTFEGGMPGDGDPMPQTYGDFVSGAGPDGNAHTYNMGNGWTPNIEVGYSAESGIEDSLLAFYGNWDGSDALYLLDSTDTADEPWDYWITFTPDAGYGAQINSFDLNDWGAGDHTIDWTIFEDSVGGTVLDSGSFGPGGDTTITTSGLSYIGTSVLELSHTGTRTYLAVDNLNFDQIPEPMTMALLGLGGLALIRRRRRV